MCAICGEDITIFHRKYNKITRQDEWHATKVSGASWYGSQKVSVSDNGLISADIYAVRIPESVLGRYVSPDEYNHMQNISGRWTVQSGDIVVRGAVNVKITSPKDVTSKYAQSFVVTGWRDNRRGVSQRHLKVEGK